MGARPCPAAVWRSTGKMHSLRNHKETAEYKCFKPRAHCMLLPVAMGRGTRGWLIRMLKDHSFRLPMHLVSSRRYFKSPLFVTPTKPSKPQATRDTGKAKKKSLASKFWRLTTPPH
ncbi:hypothetical protein TgHK011_002541 [Trichoderma gracile]|nr:hypothetical protein TgHK011_002541 [Trichoderma gracile]